MFDCKDQKSIDTVSNTLESFMDYFTDQSIANLAFQIVEANLMMVKIPWTARVIGRLRKFDDLTIIRFLFNQQPQLAKDAITSTIEHIRNGTDEEGEGIGGFNQIELEKLVEIMNPFIQALIDSANPKVDENV